jgi:hypothetical protein
MKFAVVALVLSIATGCSAPDPGEIVFGSARDGGSVVFSTGGGGAGNGPQGGAATSGAGGNAGAGTTTAGAGTTTAGAGTTTAGAGAMTLFTGTPDFAAKAPAVDSVNLGHGNVSNAGLDCFTCHEPGKTQMNAPPFAFAGTAYLDAAGTSPAVNVEVRVTSTAGTVSVYTDKSGNFWSDSQTKLPTGAKTGARNGATPKLMVGAINEGACNKCHVKGGVQAIITL